MYISYVNYFVMFDTTLCKGPGSGNQCRVVHWGNYGKPSTVGKPTVSAGEPGWGNLRRMCPIRRKGKDPT